MMYIKIDQLLTEAPEELTDCFVVEFGSSYQLEITKIDGTYKVTNGVNGWGNNCKNEFPDAKVEILVPISTSPTPLNHWIFYAERLPLKEGWYETKDSGLETKKLYHSGDGKQNVWYTHRGLVEKFTGFVSYWRPIQTFYPLNPLL